MNSPPLHNHHSPAQIGVIYIYSACLGSTHRLGLAINHPATQETTTYPLPVGENNILNTSLALYVQEVSNRNKVSFKPRKRLLKKTTISWSSTVQYEILCR